MKTRRTTLGMCVWTSIAVAQLLAPDAFAKPPQPASKSMESRGVTIEIARAPGSNSCPDSDAVYSAIKRDYPDSPIHRTRDPAKSAVSAEIKIRPTLVGHVALLTVTRPDQGQRAFETQDPLCSDLASLLALHLKLILDTVPVPEAEYEFGSPAPPSPPSPLPTKVEVSPRRAPPVKTFRADARVSSIGGLGLLARPALGASVGAELFHKSGWGLSLQGLRLWAAKANKYNGSINLTLWAAIFGPCYRLGASDAARLNFCLGLGLGSQRAEAEGFTNAKSINREWSVLEPMVRYDHGLSRFVKGFVSVGAVVQLLPQSFSVSLTPTKYTQLASDSRFGLLAELGLAVGTDVF